MHKRIKDMMNMSFKVGGLAYMLKVLNPKKKKKTATIATAQHICEQFFSSFILSPSIANVVVL
jgi:hypothetical protein